MGLPLDQVKLSNYKEENDRLEDTFKNTLR